MGCVVGFIVCYIWGLWDVSVSIQTGGAERAFKEGEGGDEVISCTFVHFVSCARNEGGSYILLVL